jgi:putative peptidoglycan lipid II flippase
MNLKRSIYLAVLSSLNILAAFLVQWMVFASLGAGRSTDALLAGMTLPNVAFAMIGGALVNVIVPLLSVENAETCRRTSWTLIAGVVASFGFITLVLVATAQFWVPWLVPGFSAETTHLTITLTRIQLPSMVFSAVASVLTAAYYAQQRFVWTQLATLIVTLANIGLLALFLPASGVVAAAWLTSLRIFVQMVLLFPIAGKPTKPNFEDAVSFEVIRRIKPLLLGTAYTKLGPVVDRFLSSLSAPGALSLLFLGQQVYGAANTVIHAAVVSPLAPTLAKAAQASNWAAYRVHYMSKLFIILCATGIVLVLMAISRETLSALNFSVGKFTTEQLAQLLNLMIGLGGVLLAGPAGQILAVAFYAKGDTITPTRVSVVGFTVAILAKVICFKFWGLLGVAIGTSIHHIFNSVILYAIIQRNIRKVSNS